jgi:hypothetical protein
MSALFAAAAVTLVFCAPGYPGASEDAQPYLTAFAAAAAKAARWPPDGLTAVYDATEAGGLEKLSKPDAALAFVPYPFFVEHQAALHLTPLVQADVTHVGVQQRWTLYAKKGKVNGPASMAGFTILSVAGYAPDFVRSSALAGWALPADVKITVAPLVLSALRRAASGEPVAVLLDATQSASLASLPFANDLQAVKESTPLPTAILAVVDARLPSDRAAALREALLGLNKSDSAADALANLQLQRFVPPQLPRATTP